MYGARGWMVASAVVPAIDARRSAKLGVAIVLLATSAAAAVTLRPGATLSHAAMVLTGASAVAAIRLGRRRALLATLAVVAYALPFVTLLGYVFADNYEWGPTPSARALSQDQGLMLGVAQIGLLGLAGLLLGLWAGLYPRPAPEPISTDFALPPTAAAAISMAALLLAWFSSPQSSIFTTSYSEISRTNLASGIGLAAGFVAVMALVVVLAVDLEAERRRKANAVKLRMFAITVLLIVGPFQLLKGSRTAVGLVLALALLRLTRQTDSAPGGRRAWWHQRGTRRVLVGLVVIGATFVVVGVVRSSLHEGGLSAGDVAERSQNYVLHGTWEAVLATNVAASIEDRDGEELLFGSTYVDYTASLIPGPIARVIGWERPITASRGPAWWSEGISLGGIHVAVVPYRNFGPLGVFIGLAAVGFVIGAVDRRSHRSAFGRTLYGCVAMACVLWFWYGDMYVVRALMALAVIWPIVRALSQRISRPTVAP